MRAQDVETNGGNSEARQRAQFFRSCSASRLSCGDKAETFSLFNSNKATAYPFVSFACSGG
jgi:hypothetical protein